MHKINEIRPLTHDYLKITECIDDLSNKLYYIGTLPQTRRPTVAIVGSRKPTAYGREVTQHIAGELARRGVVIVSGLALGVDAIAHQAALDAGGTTIAVLANGLHRYYPATNTQLGKHIIASGGAVISEYEPGVEPRDFQFLERNRIVSGLSDAVIITEAAARSGTLNTAAHALTQGKDLYVVPGNITSPMSAGCNLLLAQGASPLINIDDLLVKLLPDYQVPAHTVAKGSTLLEQRILDLLASGVRDGDAILAQLDASATEFNTALTMLEISGSIRSLGANQWTIS